MSEQFSPPPLPAIESYLDNSFEFNTLTPQALANISPGTVLRFHHQPSNRIYIFECTHPGENMPAEGWLSQVTDGQASEREPVTLARFTSLEKADHGVAYVVFSAPSIDSKPPKMHFQAPFTKAEQAFVPVIGEHLLAHALYLQERAPFETPAAQETLQKAVDFFLKRAKESGIKRYGHAAIAIFEELLKREES